MSAVKVSETYCQLSFLLQRGERWSGFDAASERIKELLSDRTRPREQHSLHRGQQGGAAASDRVHEKADRGEDRTAA